LKWWKGEKQEMRPAYCLIIKGTREDLDIADLGAINNTVEVEVKLIGFWPIKVTHVTKIRDLI